jgi:hypothetical protein
MEVIIRKPPFKPPQVAMQEEIYHANRNGTWFPGQISLPNGVLAPEVRLLTSDARVMSLTLSILSSVRSFEVRTIIAG